LLNDLFGIQSRAGCSCAGPYGHRLLDIDFEKSEQYRKWIGKGFSGIKPGWCRISLHYVMDDIEADFILDAVEFVAKQGYRFLPLYDFDLHSGAWLHKTECDGMQGFSLNAALECSGYQSRTLSKGERKVLYSAFLHEAATLANELSSQQAAEEHVLDVELESLKFFSVPQACISAD